MAQELNKKVAVISLSDLERIRRTCAGVDMREEEANRRQREREALAMRSKARMKNWGDTFEAQKIKKDQDRYKKFEQEELLRRRVDAEEEQLQNEKRREAVERANKIFHDSNDQVKAFHSKMFMSDVLQERELQLEINRKKREFQREIEFQWAELEKQQMMEFDDRMRRLLHLKEQKRNQNKIMLHNQLEEVKRQLIQEMQEEFIEGRLMKQQALNEIEKERQEMLARRQRMIQAQQETIRGNEVLKEIKRQEEQREREEERRIEEYAKKKENMDNARRNREKEKFREKQAIRQKMIDRQAEQLSRIKNTEEQRLNNQIQEAERKAQEKFEEQQRRKKELQDQIDRSRKLQMDRKAQERDHEKQEDAEFAEFWRERMSELEEADRQEKQEQQGRLKDLQNYHKKQMDFRARKAADQAAIDAELARQAQEMRELEEDQFNSYAEKCLKEWASQGKNITPMILELKNYRKRLVQLD